MERLFRVILLADTHLGFDHPIRPRVERRRRGFDFLANFRSVLEEARGTRPDLVVHGGDLFFRSKVPDPIVRLGYEPLLELADSGVPVVIVPGNHERSRLPGAQRLLHPKIHVLDRPRSLVLDAPAGRVVLAGFPFERRVRSGFAALLERTAHAAHEADLRLLCLHQAVEGATVGPSDFTFRHGEDVVPLRAIPTAFDAVLAGHIHRRQVLRYGGGRPVVYPGSIERTSFAEKDEPKGFVRLAFAPGAGRSRLRDIEFVPLPARPMVEILLEDPGTRLERLTSTLSARIARLAPDSVVRVKFMEPGESPLSASILRAIAPPTMNIDLAPAIP